MALIDYRTISRISSYSGVSSVSLFGATLNVHKVIVQDLELKALPSRDGGASFQGVAFVRDTATGQLGFFILCAANPTAGASGGMAAREVWLASWGNWASEYGSSVAGLNVLTTPSANQLISFAPITGSAPQNLNSITPTGASAGCVSATLIDHRLFLHSLDELINYQAASGYLSANSTQFAPTGSGHYITGTSNTVTLTPGAWNLYGYIDFDNNGGAPGYTELKGLWTTANGANSASVPALLSASGILEAGAEVYEFALSSVNYRDLVMPIARVNVAVNTAIYLVPYAVMSAFANSRITTRIYAQRVS